MQSNAKQQKWRDSNKRKLWVKERELKEEKKTNFGS